MVKFSEIFYEAKKKNVLGKYFRVKYSRTFFSKTSFLFSVPKLIKICNSINNFVCLKYR